jgi:hypothetical protein
MPYAIPNPTAHMAMQVGTANMRPLKNSIVYLLFLIYREKPPASIYSKNRQKQEGDCQPQ